MGFLSNIGKSFVSMATLGLGGDMVGGGEQTTSTAPWGPQQQYLKTGFSKAEGLLNQPQFSPYETQGQNMALQYANSMSPMIGNAQSALNFSLDPSILSPESNPYLSQYAEAANRPIMEALTEQMLPSIGRNAVASGQYGGSRQGIAEGLAMGKAAQAMGDTNSRIFSQAYGQGLDQMTRGMQMAPSVANLGLMPSGIYQDVGQRQYSRPWEQLGSYMNVVGGQNYGSTQTTPTPSPLPALIGAGLGFMAGGPAGAGLGMQAGRMFS